jgi:hypothetical protein
MPLADVAWVLEQSHRSCDDRGLGFGAYPMHELAAHPQVAELLGLFADHVGTAEFEPLSTTGVPLAVRQDWQDVLAAAASLGTTTVWVAFHGLGSSTTARSTGPAPTPKPAWPSSGCTRQDCGPAAMCSLPRPTPARPSGCWGALGRLQVDQMAWEPATYYPTPRGRRNERLRPRPSELLPLADRIRQLSPFHRDAWANLEAHTEAAWVARALAGDWPPQLAEAGPANGDQGLPLVCRPSLELHTGVTGRYRERHGNLRADGAQAVLSRALEQGGRSVDAVWFRPDPLPSFGELAARHGDRTGQGVHFTETSVRYLWLDRAQRRAAAVVNSRPRHE